MKNNMRNDFRDPKICAICSSPSEWEIHCCNKCISTPIEVLILRHPIRTLTIGYLKLKNKAPGD